MNKKTRIRKKIFPLGMFILLFLIQSLLVTGAVTLYFLNTGKKRIADMEQYTRNFSMTLADAFANMAELSFRTRQYRPLQALFREKIRENTIDEAFFILNNGNIVAHSNAETEKELNGNLANDEFTYNLDMILAPALRKSTDTHFSGYNIITQRNPFPRDRRELIEKYLYADVQIMGWLVSRAVYSGKKPVGTVNFLISKKRIFDFIGNHIDECILYLRRGIEGAFALSLLLSLIILLRYRSIQKKTLALASGEEGKIPDKPASVETPTAERDIPGPDFTAPEKMTLDEYITIDISSVSEDRDMAAPGTVYTSERDFPEEKFEGEIFMEDLQPLIPLTGEPVPVTGRHTVKDAIPAASRRNGQ